MSAVAPDAPSRPALRYFGGKWMLAPWIIGQFPPHRTYVEPYGGGASVLLRKPRAPLEVYNDLDDQVVGLFRVLREPAQAAALISALELTPYARAEFEAAYLPAPEGDAVERARRLIVRSFMGHGANGIDTDKVVGFRVCGNRGARGASPAVDWANYPAALAAVVRRIMGGVQVLNDPAAEVIARFDRPGVLIYLDPPYVHSTRSTKRSRGKLFSGYAHEMSDADHAALLAQIIGLKSMVVLSGYACPLYDEALAGWGRVTCETFAEGAQARTEVLWLNPAVVAASPAQRGLALGRVA